MGKGLGGSQLSRSYWIIHFHPLIRLSLESMIDVIVLSTEVVSNERGKFSTK